MLLPLEDKEKLPCGKNKLFWKCNVKLSYCYSSAGAAAKPAPTDWLMQGETPTTWCACYWSISSRRNCLQNYLQTQLGNCVSVFLSTFEGSHSIKTTTKPFPHFAVELRCKVRQIFLWPLIKAFIRDRLERSKENRVTFLFSWPRNSFVVSLDRRVTKKWSKFSHTLV